MPNDIKKRGRDGSTVDEKGRDRKRQKVAREETDFDQEEKTGGKAQDNLQAAIRLRKLYEGEVVAQDAAIKATGNLVVNQMDRKYPGFLEMFNACKRAFQGPAKECNDIQAQETKQVRPK